jgi:membrane protein YqaA with SNARE-associated domain
MMSALDAVWPYGLIAVLAFLGGSLMPASSEAALLAQIKLGLGTPWGLVAAATVGNTAGATFSWWIGRQVVRFKDRPWFPFKPEQLDRAEARFRTWGLATLPMSWLPFVGDVLVCVAGIFRVPLWQFIPLVALGAMLSSFWASRISA